jgi:hypothetical protein
VIPVIVKKLYSLIESNYIKKTKLKRKEEKKLKKRNLKRRRQNSYCASARLATETRLKTGHVTSILANAVILLKDA